MTNQAQTPSVTIDLNKLAQAIEDTKRGLSFYRCPPDTTHLDDLLERLLYRAETGEEHAELCRLADEVVALKTAR